MTSAGASGPNLQGQQSTYTTVANRALRWLGVIVLGFNAVAAVIRLWDEPDAFDIALSIVQLVCWSLWLCVLVVLPAAMTLDQQGLRFRTFLRYGHLISWPRVREVQVQGRWQEASTVILEDGTSKRLVGMPAKHAQRLADALTAWRAPANGAD